MKKTKICSKCNTEKDAKEYSLQSSTSDGLSYWCKDCCKQYAKDNKEVLREYRKQYYKDNKEAIIERKKQYYKDNKEAISERNKQYKEDNREAAYERNKQYREDNRETIRQYKKDNRDICNMINQRRRAKKKQLPNTLTLEQWEQCKQYFKNSCAYCGEEKPLAREHFIPLSKGGEYTHNNIIPVCRNCNSRKNNKAFEEFYPKYEHYNKTRELKILKYLGYENSDKGVAIS